MRRIFFGLLVIIAASLVVLSCGGGGGGGSSNPPGRSIASGTVFVTGSDAPLPSVLAFEVTLNSLALSDGSSSMDVLAGPTAVEFGRLLGMRTLLALNSVPAGTYTSATFNLASPVISYLDISTSPASVATIAGTLTSSSITIALTPPLVVGENGLGGLHMDFRLRESLQLDGAGQITGVVDPHLRARVLPPGHEDRHVDELRGGLSSVDVAGNSFVMQRRAGRTITVRVNAATHWEGTDSLATLAPPAIVEVGGLIQADGSLLADEVEVLTTDSAFAAGIVLGTVPAAGPADTLTLLVREEIPDLSGIQIGCPATVGVTAATRFDIHNFELPIEDLLFNRSALVLGQRVGVGGAINPATSSIDARRVILHRQGMDGVAVTGSVVVVSGDRGHFDLVNNGFFGYLFAAPLRIRTSDRTRFVNLSDLAAVSAFPDARLRVAGLLLRDPATGGPVLAAGLVERLTD